MTEIDKKRFVVKNHYDASVGIHRRDVFIDDKLFEYEIDQDSLQKAKQMGTSYYVTAQRDIQKHFLDSLSDFIGRPITAMELLNATQSGWI